MVSLLAPGDDELCPCGSKKKWRACHGGPEALAPIAESQDVDPVLFALAENILRLLKDATDAVGVDYKDSDYANQYRRRCLVYFARKMYRVTLAGISLIRLGQTTQAFTMKRDQHYAWVSFMYYLDNERQSILFTASGALRQRDSAKKIMTFDQDAENDPKRQKQLRDHEATSEMLYREFPDLRVAKGKSGGTSNPIWLDWKEPDEQVMMEYIVGTWPEHFAKMGKPIPETEAEEWCRREVARTQFFHAKFPSQDLHGTPMGLISEFADEGENDESGTENRHEPNELLYIYLWYPMGVAERMIEFSGLAGVKDRKIKIQKALGRWRDHFAGDVSEG